MTTHSSSWSYPVNFYQEVELQRSDGEYVTVKEMFERTIAPQHSERGKYLTLEMVRLMRIQNPLLWNHFALKAAELHQDEHVPFVENALTECIDPGVNMFYLFHGSSYSLIDTIAKRGFDERLANLHGMFGSGIYFAENSSKSDLFSHTAACTRTSDENVKCGCSPGSEKVRACPGL